MNKVIYGACADWLNEKKYLLFAAFAASLLGVLFSIHTGLRATIWEPLIVLGLYLIFYRFLTVSGLTLTEFDLESEPTRLTHVGQGHWMLELAMVVEGTIFVHSYGDDDRLLAKCNGEFVGYYDRATQSGWILKLKTGEQ